MNTFCNHFRLNNNRIKQSLGAQFQIGVFDTLNFFKSYDHLIGNTIDNRIFNNGLLINNILIYKNEIRTLRTNLLKMV